MPKEPEELEGKEQKRKRNEGAKPAVIEAEEIKSEKEQKRKEEEDMAKIEEEKTKRENRIKKANEQQKSWELLRMCKQMIESEGTKW